MELIRHRPVSVFDELRREMNNLSGIFNGEELWPARLEQTSKALTQWAPAVDIKEEPDRFIVTADVPGVQAADIDVTFENGVLSITGERKSEATEEKDGFKRVERAYGRFERRFSLPENIDDERIAAKGKDGVLEITLPKKESVKPKKISVQ